MCVNPRTLAWKPPSLELSGVSREEIYLRGNQLCDVKIDTPLARALVSLSSTSTEFPAIGQLLELLCVILEVAEVSDIVL